MIGESLGTFVLLFEGGIRLMNEPVKTKITINNERGIYLIGTAGEVSRALKEKAKEEIDEVLNFQKDWHRYVAKHVGKDYWGKGNNFVILDHNGEVEVYEMGVSVNPRSGGKRYTRKRKLLGCTKARNGEVIGYVLIKDANCDWCRTAGELIEKYKKTCKTS